MAIVMRLVPTIVSTTVRQLVLVLHWALVHMDVTIRPSIDPMVLAVALATVLTIVPCHCPAWDWAYRIHPPHTEQVVMELAREHRDRGDHPSRAARRATISSRSRPGTKCDVISCGAL